MNINRLDEFISILPDDIDAALVFDTSNRHYLTGVDTSDAGTLVVTREKAFFIIDSRYIELAERYENEKMKVVLQENLFSQIKDICSKQNVKKIGIETQTLSVSMHKTLANRLENILIDTCTDISQIIMDLRSVKSEDEINKIKQAQKITDEAFDYILGKITEGKSEKDLALELEFFMRSNGARAASFDIIFIGGKNTSLPHGVPGDYRLKNGDFITIDFGADVDGYKSDMTRTVALGKVSDDQKKVYETVLSAQKNAISQIRAGNNCCEIDKIARDIIDNSGYCGLFGHALGHSVGLDIHESPNFSPKCNTILKSNMVLTVEPGIYLPQKFGVRIEDMVLVTENGVENLTKSTKSLIIL